MKYKKLLTGFTSLVATGAFLAMSSGNALAAPAPQYGGTLRLVAASSVGTIDPQINYQQQYWQIFQMVYDGLVAFRKAGGALSNQLVPDLAVSVPVPTDNGLTYTFTLRKGIRFSDGQPVTVEAVKHSFIRLFKVLNPNAGAWYSVIKGGALCVSHPNACTLPGLVINPKTDQVVFHLTHPDPTFLYQLAVPFGSVLPADAPNTQAGSVPLPGEPALI